MIILPILLPPNPWLTQPIAQTFDRETELWRLVWLSVCFLQSGWRGFTQLLTWCNDHSRRLFCPSSWAGCWPQRRWGQPPDSSKTNRAWLAIGHSLLTVAIPIRTPLDAPRLLLREIGRPVDIVRSASDPPVPAFHYYNHRNHKQCSSAQQIH